MRSCDSPNFNHFKKLPSLTPPSFSSLPLWKYCVLSTPGRTNETAVARDTLHRVKRFNCLKSIAPEEKRSWARTPERKRPRRRATLEGGYRFSYYLGRWPEEVMTHKFSYYLVRRSFG